MKLSRVLSSLRPSSSTSQTGKWPVLRAATALQASSLSTALAAKPATRKSTRAAREPVASTPPPPPEEKWEHDCSPPQEAPPSKVVAEEAASAAPRLSKPSEIPWQGKVANSVHLIGRLAMPIQLNAAVDGAYTAVSILVQEKTHDLPNFWVPIVFQGDLAQIAACNLREKDHVYVTGQLTGGSQLIENNVENKTQVMVDSVSYVLGLHSEKKHDGNSAGPGSISSEVKDVPFDLELWNDLFAYPHKWLDYRSKGSKRSGTFKHKDTGQVLEITESTPEWVLEKMDTLVFSSKTSSRDSQIANAKKSRESVVGHWSDLLENPQEWWDNRGKKISPKSPDFSHKKTRQGLWLNSAPDWVLPKLKNAKVSAEVPQQSEAKKISARPTKKEESWRDLMDNPDKWWDKRSKKSNPKAPDFKHKETGEALWLISSTTPKWVLNKYPSTSAGN